MTFPFPTGDLARMQSAQQEHMPDVCHRMVYSRTKTASGAFTEQWTEDPTDIPCGVNQQNRHTDAEKVQEKMTVILQDAIARLPIEQAEVWDAKDRFKLVSRFGTALAVPIIYGINAPIMRGPSAIRLSLQKVEV